MSPFLYGVCITLLYIIVALVIMLTARKFLKIPAELFRKILHFVLLGAYIPLVFSFEQWWHAVIFAASLIIVLFPALALAGKIPQFSAFVNERKKGEFKSSMVLAIGMMIFSISIGWGVFGDKYFVLASIYAWGVGDAFAALIGKRFGKHKIKWKLADARKSIEGSIAMFVCAFVSVLTVLLIRGGLEMPACLCVAFLSATVCTVSELCAKNGWDTVICPTAAMLVIIPLALLL